MPTGGGGRSYPALAHPIHGYRKEKLPSIATETYFLVATTIEDQERRL